MHDLVIRNGLIVDGTGAETRPGDVVLRDGQATKARPGKLIRGAQPAPAPQASAA